MCFSNRSQIMARLNATTYRAQTPKRIRFDVLEGVRATFRRIVLVILPASLLLPSGCDYLPEAITGIPDPQAQALQPAGPTASGITGDSISTTPVSAPIAWNGGMDNATGVSTADAQESAGGTSDTSVIPSGGSGVTDSFLSTLTAPGANSSISEIGLPVPAAMSMPASGMTTTRSDGRIVVTANLRFVNDQEVAAPADGLITILDVDEGDVVVKGNLIGQLDDRLPKSELAVATKEHEAAVEKAKDKSEIEYSQASVGVADEDYRITKELEAKGASNAMELSKKWLEFKRAGLAVTVAEVKNRQDVSAVGVAEAKKGAAAVQIELRRIVSPFDGIVADKKKDRHDWVRAGEVIMRLVSMEQIRVTGQVFSAQLKRAPHELVGSPVVVDIEVFPGKTERVNAKIGFISPVMDTSGGYKIWAQIPNVQSAGQWVFREGMPATIEFSAN
jgi:multidrug efflux pump subunit AcrA (membrane-fusion protein)